MSISISAVCPAIMRRIIIAVAIFCNWLASLLAFITKNHSGFFFVSSFFKICTKTKTTVQHVWRYYHLHKCNVGKHLFFSLAFYGYLDEKKNFLFHMLDAINVQVIYFACCFYQQRIHSMHMRIFVINYIKILFMLMMFNEFKSKK